MGREALRMQWLVMAIFLLLVGTSIVPAVAQNTEKQSSSRGYWLYVGGSGPGNYSKIQDALNFSIDGDTVFVYDDNAPYLEQLTIDTTITLLGENRTTTIINSTADEFYTVLTIKADDVHLSGFTIVFNGGNGVEILSNHTMVSNLTLQSGIQGWSGIGIRLSNARDTLITDSLITRAQIAIFLAESAGTSITNNLIIDPGLNGIIVLSSHNFIDGNTIMGNLEPYTKPIGIYLSGSANTISHNTIQAMVGNATDGISLNHGTDNVLEGNVLVNTGFVWYASERNTVTNNSVNGKPFVFRVGQSNEVIDDAGQVILINCTRMTIQNLTLFNSRYGIYLHGTTDSIIQHCIISECWYGVDLEVSQDNIIQYNTISHCEDGIFIYQGSLNRVENNTITESMYYGLLISSKNTQVSFNQIDSCSIGIMVSQCRSSRVTGNTIQHCTCGVYLEMATATTVAQNNFFDTLLDATFYTSLLNHWVGNYWGSSRLLPKIILGSLLVYDEPTPYGRTIIIPWINIDLHPAQTPL
jgi:parallel beta-helix repeat protein